MANLTVYLLKVSNSRRVTPFVVPWKTAKLIVCWCTSAAAASCTLKTLTLSCFRPCDVDEDAGGEGGARAVAASTGRAGKRAPSKGYSASRGGRGGGATKSGAVAAALGRTANYAAAEEGTDVEGEEVKEVEDEEGGEEVADEEEEGGGDVVGQEEEGVAAEEEPAEEPEEEPEEEAEEEPEEEERDSSFDEFRAVPADEDEVGRCRLSLSNPS